jgi:pSer/pThr/pTyr-binding forkhead associated (FHA) protein
MPRLKILLRGAQISDIGLNPDREYIGGRKENCDIRLQAEKGISREHFKVKFEDGRWVISALSRFGEIYSQGQRVESFPLEHGQTFQVPPYDFQFSDVPEAHSVHNGQAPEVGANESTVIGATQQVPYIKMMNASGTVQEMLRLEVGDIWVAGRDSSCQIIIPDQRVSRRQFEIRKLNGVFTAIDLGSVNGTFLNGVPISSTDPQSLKSGDAISVLDNMMYFELHDPNFQYRMDRLEIPPLQQVQNEEIHEDEFVSSQDEFASADPMMLQQIEQPYVDQMNQQFDPSGGPFTGMPSGSQAENQFYSFQQGPGQPVLTGWQKFKQNKPLVAISILLFLSLAYFASDFLNPTDEFTQIAKPTDGTDPFSRLKPEEQKTIKDLYSLAQKSMLQQKYSFAKENIEKIHQILPTGYEESKAMLEEAVSSELTLISQQEQLRLEKEKAEQDKKIAETIEICKKLLSPEITLDQMKECLVPVALIDPTNNEYIKLITEVEKIISAKKSKADDQLNYQSQVESLEKLFEKAEKIQAEGYPYKAIKAYRVVISSVFPDPENLKEKSKSRISYIQKKIQLRTAENLKNADEFLQQGKLKQGILALRAALVYDPENKTVKEKIDKSTNDLRKQVMVMYQESVIDENFGHVDGNETRPGAKDKWKKIIELDLEDGEYYRKAFVKLHRYGAL